MTTRPAHLNDLPNADPAFIEDFTTSPGPVAPAGSLPTPTTVGAGAAALAQALYLTEAGDTTAINVDDLHQGQLGDCFLISSMGELALFHPSEISNDIKANPNGTETVTLYTAANGALPAFGTTAFKPVAVTVSNVFPSYGVNNAPNQDVVGTQKEIWGQVLEKAVATLDGGYGAIANGGNPVIAMEELTGQSASAFAASRISAAQITALSQSGNMLVFDTANSTSLPDNLVGNHAYMFEKMTTVNGVASVQLANSWGFDQPAAVPVSQLAKAFVEIDVGRVS